MVNKAVLLHLICEIIFLVLLGSNVVVKADDPYRYYTWTVSYGTLSPLGVPQQVCNFGYLFIFQRSDLGVSNKGFFFLV